MPPSTRQRTRRRRLRRASSASAFPIARPRVPSAGREQKKRWFRAGQTWRTGCEGRISVVKRRHGLNRCRYKGDAGMQRWVGPRRHRRQSHQHRPRHGPTGRTLTGLIAHRRSSRRVPPALFLSPPALRIDIFAPESSYGQVPPHLITSSVSGTEGECSGVRRAGPVIEVIADSAGASLKKAACLAVALKNIKPSLGVVL